MLLKYFEMRLSLHLVLVNKYFKHEKNVPQNDATS